MILDGAVSQGPECRFAAAPRPAILGNDPLKPVTEGERIVLFAYADNDGTGSRTETPA